MLWVLILPNSPRGPEGGEERKRRGLDLPAQEKRSRGRRSSPFLVPPPPAQRLVNRHLDALNRRVAMEYGATRCVRDEALGEYPVRSGLIPLGTQYGATHSKPGNRKPFTYAGFAALCKPLQRPTDHS